MLLIRNTLGRGGLRMRGIEESDNEIYADGVSDCFYVDTIEVHTQTMIPMNLTVQCDSSMF